MLHHSYCGYSPRFLSLLTFICIYFWPPILFSFHAWTEITSFFPPLIIRFSSHPLYLFLFSSVHSYMFSCYNLFCLAIFIAWLFPTSFSCPVSLHFLYNTFTKTLFLVLENRLFFITAFLHLLLLVTGYSPSYLHLIVSQSFQKHLSIY